MVRRGSSSKRDNPYRHPYCRPSTRAARGQAKGVSYFSRPSVSSSPITTAGCVNPRQYPSNPHSLLLCIPFEVSLSPPSSPLLLQSPRDFDPRGSLDLFVAGLLGSLPSAATAPKSAAAADHTAMISCRAGREAAHGMLARDETLLQFHRDIVKQLLDEDGMCIMAAGLGLDKVKHPPLPLRHLRIY